jgi:hypothetical protein
MYQESVGLRVNLLQILSGRSIFRCFFGEKNNYCPAKSTKSVLVLPNFRFDFLRPTDSQRKVPEYLFREY